MLLICLVPLAGRAQTSNNAQFYYDAAGRLSAVLDPVNGTSVYNYDAVGNILNVVSNPASALVVANVSPPSGKVGTVVTIAGTGFGTTANTSVSFNGTAATPSAVTANAITVAVPSGAKSGTISVTSPAGTVTTASIFTVGATPAPTITSIPTATIAGGASITVGGTNFNPSAVDDNVLLNGRFVRVTAAAKTSITAITPPAATSGHVTVETPAGSATSSGYVAVAPNGYAASAVADVTPVTIGNSVTNSVGASGQIGLILFDATAGQRAAVTVTAATVGGTLQVLAPDGSQIGGNIGVSIGNSSGAVALPQTGTYTVVFIAGGVGSVTLGTTNVPPDATSTIVENGPAVQLTTTSAYQDMRLTFSGVAGGKASITVSEQTPPTAAQYLTVIAPDGATVVYSSGCCTQSQNIFTNAFNLPETGTYTIVLAPSGTSILGTATFNLYNAATVAGAISISTLASPSPVTLTASDPGQALQLTFSGTAGTAVSLVYTESCTGTTGLCGNGNPAQYLQIIAPDGSTSVYNSGCCGAPQISNGVGTFFTNTISLPQTGTYTITLSPSTPNTGAATFTLYNATTVTGTIAISSLASPKPTTLTAANPGQQLKLTFSGTTGKSVSLVYTEPCSGSSGLCGNGNPSQYLQFIAPDGTTVVYGSGCCGAPQISNGVGTFFTNAITLPQTGTYTIVLAPSTENTGSATFTLYNATPATSPISISTLANPLPVALTTANPGQSLHLTFTGTAGTAVSLIYTEPCSGSSGLCGNGDPAQYLQFIAPDGTTVAYSSGCCGAPQISNGVGTFFTNAIALPQTGTYTITLAPSTTNTGSATFTLFNATKVTGTITPGGAAVPLTASDPGQLLQLTYSGTAGQAMSLQVTEPCSGTTGLCGNGNPAQYLQIIAPDGSTYVYNSGCCGAPQINNGIGTLFTNEFSLPQTGTYTINLSPSVANTGSATFSLFVDPTNVVPIQANGQTVNVTTAQPGQRALLSFSGTTGEAISMTVTEAPGGLNTGNPAQYLTITAPDGTTVVYNSGCCGTPPFWTGKLTLTQTGTYSIALAPSTENTGTASFTLYSVPANVSASTTIGAAAKQLSTTVPGQGAQITFPATVGSTFTFNVTAVSEPGCNVGTIYEPDGVTVLVQSLICGTSDNIPSGTLPSTGTYTAVVTPGGPNIGTYSLGVTAP